MDRTEQRWRELCVLAAVEQDPKKLMELVRETAHLLGEKHDLPKPKPEDTPDKPVGPSAGS
ncbi:MAG: hypothetical protein WA628_13240 [Terriglobales bacterium]